MQKCGICGFKSAELYAVDDHVVCEVCLMRGRLDELPEFATADQHEAAVSRVGGTISSWWNRDIPEKISSVHRS